MAVDDAATTVSLNNHKYRFDRVFGRDSTQEDVFDYIRYAGDRRGLRCAAAHGRAPWPALVVPRGCQLLLCPRRTLNSVSDWLLVRVSPPLLNQRCCESRSNGKQLSWLGRDRIHTVVLGVRGDGVWRYCAGSELHRVRVRPNGQRKDAHDAGHEP